MNGTVASTDAQYQVLESGPYLGFVRTICTGRCFPIVTNTAAWTSPSSSVEPLVWGSHCTVFGRITNWNSHTQLTLVVQLSHNGQDWFGSGYGELLLTAENNTDFSFFLSCSAPFLRVAPVSPGAGIRANVFCSMRA